MNGDLDTLAVEPPAPLVPERTVSGDTVGVILREYENREWGHHERHSAIAFILAASIAKEILAAPIGALEASVWASQTCGSRYQDATALLRQEEQARQYHRAALLIKKHFGSLSSSEANQLEALQAQSEERLATEMESAIAFVRSFLEE